MKQKADILIEIAENVKEVKVLPIFVVESNLFFSNKDDVLNKVIDFAKNKRLIVRSSSKNEDSELQSNAGKYKTLLNVKPIRKDISDAIEAVYKSYNTNDNEKILIQPMLDNIKKSGVIFTVDIDTFADYYIVNYSETDDTSAVTSGEKNRLITYVEYKNSIIKSSDCGINKLINQSVILQKYFNNDALDIEFAIDKNDEVYIFQVRPIVKGNKNNCKLNLDYTLNRIHSEIKQLANHKTDLLGDKIIFGIMPDWNPAEILGVRPKQLAISLYKELITDKVWAEQRRDYGYRDLTKHPLMVSFCGIPYIDTRVSLNSFIPSSLDNCIANKLADYYLNKLEKNPKYHDKIEFEIAYTCYYFGLHEDLNELLNNGFNETEIKQIENSLRELTNRIINPINGLYKKDIEKIKILSTNYKMIVSSNISLEEKIYKLIEECKTYGTLPFAGVARSAFIAVQFLKSFVNLNIISQNDYDNYMNSLDTINREFNFDLCSYREGKISKNDFLIKYGHIRPGTYDILSKRYDEAFDEYFGDGQNISKGSKCGIYTFTDKQIKSIENELHKSGINITYNQLMLFIKESIEGRESLKLFFTKSVSKILQLIEEIGLKHSIKREDLAYLDVNIIKGLYTNSNTNDTKQMIQDNITKNKEEYEKAILVKLPALITSPNDAYSFTLLMDEPNFITQKKVRGKVRIFDKSQNYNLEGKIVFIISADPGFDFLFSKNIGGLITQFGGANSHMAIRCAELGIPAIIGAGESNYNEWCKYDNIEIDCLNKRIIHI